MESKVVFGRWEASAILINVICTQIFLSFPANMMEIAGTAGWLLVIYCTAISLVLMSIILKLYKPFEGKDILDISSIAGGNAAKAAYGMILIIYLVFISSLVLRQYAEYMKIVIFSVTPISVITMIFAIGMYIAAYKGIEAICRVSAIFVPITALGFAAIAVGIAPYYDFSRIFPLLGSGSYNIFIAGATRVSIFSGLSMLPMIAPFLRTDKNLRHTGFTVLAVSGFLFVFSVLIITSTFSYPVALEKVLPIFQTARLINIGRFFQRVESVFVLTWAASALLYLSASFFFIAYIFIKTFGIEYYKPILLPVGTIIFALSFLPSSVTSTIVLEQLYFGNYAWIVAFALPIIALLAARARIPAAEKGEKNVKKV